MAEPIEDELLVEQFSRGDESAFEKIVEHYSAEVAALANRLLGWPGEVEDVTQDIFLAVFVGLRKFRCECSLRTWLFAITINRCRTYRQRRLLRLRGFPRTARTMSSPSDTAHKTAADAEAFERVRRAVATLPARYREPVVLRYLQGLGTEEIGRILGISTNAVNVRLNRARGRLRDRLAQPTE